MKKFKLALLILGISFFASCSGDVVENTVAEDSTMAKLTVIVRDAITGELIDGAEVSLLPSEIAVTRGGIVSFNDVRIGTQNLKIEKTDYASVSTVTSNNSLNPIAVNQTGGEYMFTADERSVTVFLYPKTASVYGYVFYSNAKGQILPAEGAKVYAELASEAFIVRLFEVQTDINGKYSFESLPASANARIWAVAPEGGLDGIRFESVSLAGSLTLSAGSYYVGRGSFTQNNANFEASFNSTVAKDGDIVFTFTESIDQSSIKFSDNAYNSTVRVVPAATVKWEWESNKLTITPLHEWEDDITVTFRDLKSASGKLFRNLSEVTVNITLELEDLSGTVVDGVAVVSPENFNYDATSADLRWNIVEDAKYYAIYRKGDRDSSYVLEEGGWFPAIKGATIGSRNGVSLGGALNGRTVSFIVRAKNNASMSLLDPAKAVDVIDKVKPTLITSSNPKCIVFNEPIDKKSLSITPLTDIKPSSDFDICIDPVVTAQTQYNISGIKDQYGNLYGANGTRAITINP